MYWKGKNSVSKKQDSHSIESGADEKHPPFVMRLGLILRNIFTLLAAILFLISILIQHQNHALKVLAYFLGMLAYFSEYLHLTKFFREKIPHEDLFMIYCFAPIYLLMGISYMFH